MGLGIAAPHRFRPQQIHLDAAVGRALVPVAEAIGPCLARKQGAGAAPYRVLSDGRAPLIAIGSGNPSMRLQPILPDAGFNDDPRPQQNPVLSFNDGSFTPSTSF